MSSLDALLSLGDGQGDHRKPPAESQNIPIRPPLTAVESPIVPSDATIRPGIGELREIDIDAVVPNEFQPRRRFEEESLAALTESVRELGVLQPILVRPGDDGRYELIAGERRWRAARRAGLRVVSAIVRVVDDVGSLEQAIVENLHRQDLNALEEAAAYQQLVDDFGFTQDQVATRVGKSRSAVSNALRLFQLPPAVQRLVTSGQLSAGHARAVLSVSGPAAQHTLAERIVEEGLTVRESEAAAKALDSGAQRPQSSRQGSTRAGPKTASALEIERLLEERLETSVEIVEAAGSGRIVIRYADDEDLGRIYRLLGD